MKYVSFSITKFSDGFWPAFSGGSREHASTYTTAWAAIGLDSQLRAHLIASDDVVGEIRTALDRAMVWLMETRLPGLQWSPYPHRRSVMAPSDAISGAVVHALTRVVPDPTAELAADWFSGLSDEVPSADSGERFYIELRAGGRTHIDHFVQLPMPWMLIRNS